MSLREKLQNDTLVDALLLEELKDMLEDVIDPVVEKALHIVVAYCSVPGTYMEGAYDGTDDS